MSEETNGTGKGVQFSEEAVAEKVAQPKKYGGSRAAKRFEEKVGVSPSEYIESNIDSGSASRWDVGKTLTDATEGTVNISASTAWQIVKKAQKQGDLSGFFFRRKPKVPVECSVKTVQEGGE